MKREGQVPSGAGQKGHRRRSAPIAAMLVALLTCGVARAVNPVESDPAAALISRARTALGPGLGRLKSLHLAGTLSAGDVSGPTELWVDLVDSRFAIYTNAGPLTEAYGYDGHSAWSSDSKGIVLPQTGPLARAIAANAIFDNVNALFSPGYGGAKVSYLGAQTDAGKNYEAISAKPKGGFAEEYWFDPATALPARTIVNYGAETVTTSISGYHSVGGLMVPGGQTVTRRFDLKDFEGHEQGFYSHDLTCKYTVAEADVGSVDSHLKPPPFVVSDVSLPGGETRIPFVMQNF